MELVLSQDGKGRTVLSVSGDIDTQVADELREAALREANNGPDFAIDLSQVTFIDSSGLAALIAINNAMPEPESRLTLLAPARSVRRILDLTGLNPAFTIVD